MRTGFTYGQRLEAKPSWEFADKILRLAEKDFNARKPTNFPINLELSWSEETAVESSSRIYEIEGVGEKYTRDIEVALVEGTGILLETYTRCDEVFHEYGESIGRVQETSPMDRPESLELNHFT